MSKSTLGWTDIPVLDLNRAIAFYSGMLSAPTMKVNIGPGMDIGILPDSETGPSGCLYVADDNAPSVTGPLIYLSVEGRLAAALAFVQDHGGKIITDRHQIGPHGYRGIVLDSEGNRIALHSDAP